jgi:hypothetical protein
MGGVELCPELDYREDLGGRHVGEGLVVEAGEGEDVAFALDRLNSK